METGWHLLKGGEKREMPKRESVERVGVAVRALESGDF